MLRGRRGILKTERVAKGKFHKTLKATTTTKHVLGTYLPPGCKYCSYITFLIITAILWIALSLFSFAMWGNEKRKRGTEFLVNLSHVTQLAIGRPRSKHRQWGWGSQALNHDTCCLLKLITKNPQFQWMGRTPPLTQCLIWNNNTHKCEFLYNPQYSIASLNYST